MSIKAQKWRNFTSIHFIHLSISREHAIFIFSILFYIIDRSRIHSEDKIRILLQNMRSKHQDECNGRGKDHFNSSDVGRNPRGSGIRLIAGTRKVRERCEKRVGTSCFCTANTKCVYTSDTRLIFIRCRTMRLPVFSFCETREQIHSLSTGH